MLDETSSNIKKKEVEVDMFTLSSAGKHPKMQGPKGVPCLHIDSWHSVVSPHHMLTILGKSMDL